MTRKTHSFLITYLKTCSKEKQKSSLDNLLNMKIIDKRGYKYLIKAINGQTKDDE